MSNQKSRMRVVRLALAHEEQLKNLHGDLYERWLYMLSRCEDPEDPSYQYYGARGIAVCERWHYFENFLNDMGRIPQDHSLDRIDNDGDYEPNNVRWATHAEQQNNRRPRKPRERSEPSEISGVPRNREELMTLLRASADLEKFKKDNPYAIIPIPLGRDDLLEVCRNYRS